MKVGIGQALIDTIDPQPQITMQDLEATMRRMYQHDPEKGARMIGNMYGHIFKKKEAIYDGKIKEEK